MYPVKMENNQWLDYTTSNDTHRTKNTHSSRVSALFFCTFQFYLFSLHIYIYIYTFIHIYTFYCAVLYVLCFPGWTWRGSTLRDYTIKWIRNEITPPTRYFRISNPHTRLAARFYFQFAVSPSLPCALRRRVYDDAWIWQSFVRHAPSVVYMRMWCMRAGGRCSFIWRGWNGSYKHGAVVTGSYIAVDSRLYHIHPSHFGAL